MGEFRSLRRMICECLGLLDVVSVLTACPYQCVLDLKRYMREVVLRVRLLSVNEKFSLRMDVTL